MKTPAARIDSDLRLNRHLGWALLILGFAWAAWLDPWTLGERDPSALIGSPRMAARNAQAVLLGMALLQLMVAQVLTTSRISGAACRRAAQLTALGAAIYALGYVLRIGWPDSAWLIPAGALMNLIGFGMLAWQSWGKPVVTAASKHGLLALRWVLPVIAFGMLLDVTMGLFVLSPEQFRPAFLGPEDGVRLRMLRLARAAAIALPVLALLYEDLAARAGSQPVVRWGRIGMLCGAAGMPVVLTAAAFLSVHLKYLLPVPADAIFAGTLIGTWLAARHARRLELWGWLLIALSMAAGMLMGMYAFDGPLPPPAALGAYNDFPRRLTRLVHAYAIVLGLTSLFVARATRKHPGAGSKGPGVALLVTGSIITFAIILLTAGMGLPTSALGLGPALVAVALVLVLIDTAAPGRPAEE